MISEIKKPEIKFEENVILMDAAYIDKVTGNLIAHFSKIIDRTLPNADLSLFLEAVSLDAGIRPEEDKEVADRIIQVIIVYDRESKKLINIMPQDVEKSLNNVAFKSKLGEFTLNAFNPQDMADKEKLFIETLKLLVDSKEVKHLMVVGDEQRYVEEVYKLLEDNKQKERVTVFGMNPPKQEQNVNWEMLGFAVLRALGIKSEELQ